MMTDNVHDKNLNDGVEQEDLNSEVVYEEDAGPAAIQKLRSRIKVLEKEKREYLDGWQRMKADVVNRDKAAAEERARVGDIVKEKILEDLLPVLDAFDAAFTGAAWEKVDTNWRIGVEYIHSQFLKTLEENGIKSFGAVGDTFDPIKHDLADGMTSEEESTNAITKIIRKGYEIQGRVIRPARVSLTK